MHNLHADFGGKILSVCLLLLCLSPAVRAAESPQDSAAGNLALYAHIVDSLQSVVAKVHPESIVNVNPCTTTATRFCAGDYADLVDFLKVKKDFAVSIQARLRAGVLLYADYIGSVLPELKGILSKENEFSERLAAHPISRRENDAYVAYVYPLLSRSFLSYAVASNTLLRTKYFSHGDEGNFLEGYFNGLFGFTRAEADPSKTGLENFGVSPLELLMRVEPIYLMRDNDIQNFGGLFSTGLLFHFFPSVRVVDDSKGSVQVKNSFASTVLQDVGFKLGVGAHGDKINWMAGGAVQVNAFALWYVYSWKDDRYNLALSVSDLAVVKTLLPIFK